MLNQTSFARLARPCQGGLGYPLSLKLPRLLSLKLLFFNICPSILPVDCISLQMNRLTKKKIMEKIVSSYILLFFIGYCLRISQ